MSYHKLILRIHTNSKHKGYDVKYALKTPSGRLAVFTITILLASVQLPCNKALHKVLASIV